MKNKIRYFYRESTILNFFANFNKNILVYFYNSTPYKLFSKAHSFFINTILKNMDKSIIIKITKNMINSITIRDAGIFILLVVIFNTLAMVILGRNIDIFSICARIFFFCLGVVLIFLKKQ